MLLTIAAVAVASFHASPSMTPRPYVAATALVSPYTTPGRALSLHRQFACMAEAAASPDKPGGFRAWMKKWASFDKDKIKTLGIDAFFTYGVVSNLNVALLTAIAWTTFSTTTGLSPLAPGQWKGFVATYGALYISLGSIMRPFRMAFAVTATPVYTAFVTRIRSGLPFAESNPKLNRTLALIVVSLVFNMAGTFLLIAGGAWVAGQISGVPPLPPGRSLMSLLPGRG